MKKNYPILFYLSALLLAKGSFAQPKLVGTMTYGGTQNGGTVFRNNLPSTTPSIIHPFNNLAPHGAPAGVVAGDNNWLYGVLNYNGAIGTGAFYRIHKDGTGFTVLQTFAGNTQVIPTYHTDGMIYYTDNFQIKRFNPSTSLFADIGNGGLTKSLLIDSNDWIYFTNSYTISKIKTDGSGAIDLHTFIPATEGNGGFAGLTEAPGDSLFGTNYNGGTADGGTLYSIKKDGDEFTVLHQFTAATGINPESKLVYFNGRLYGTTSYGGDYSIGVLYSINADGTDYRVLHHFDPGSPAVGNISGNISIAADGTIFGQFTQFYYSGGLPYRLYKIDTSGANFKPFLNAIDYNQHNYGHFQQDILLTDNDETIFLITREMGRHEGGALSVFDTVGFGSSLYHFGYSALGFKPTGGLIKGSNQKLFGTTMIGGVDGNGIVYSMNQDGTGYTKLHEFTDAEGYELSGKLLEASDGKLYGAAHWGGPTNSGFIYRLNKDGSSFQVTYTFPNFSDGYSPMGSLVEDNTGVLYGTAFYSSGGGSVFKINKDGSNFTALKVFDGVTGIHYPYSGVILFGDYLYGVCAYGGIENKGGVFRLRRDGSGYQDMHVFQGATDGNSPRGSLYLASNGKLYGTTLFGGDEGYGTVFRIDTTGSNYTILRSFLSTADGAYPDAGVIQASDLLLYGTTGSGNGFGVYGGTFYKMNLDGSGYTVLHAFDDQTEGAGISGLLDLNGNFVLPVQLVSFDAEKKGQTALVTWKTAQEQNSDRFEIERSNNGVTFKLIGTVASAGNSTTPKSYSLVDNIPLAGVNYYRLKQIDIDGAITYSRVASVNFEKPIQVSVFPNPASNRLFIRMPDRSNFSSVRILDASGKVVLQKDIASTAVELDVRTLPKGWYVIQLSGDDKAEKIFVKE